VEAKQARDAVGYQDQSSTELSAEALLKRSASCVEKGINKFFFSKIMVSNCEKRR
jgi:hypothetical protein